jgi:hypothetical protein
MEKRLLITLANALLSQHGYDQNGSKITDSSKNQTAFERKIIIIKTDGKSYTLIQR